MARNSFHTVAAATGAMLAALLALTACQSSSRPPGRNDANAPVAEPNAQLYRSRIRSWTTPNDHTVVVIADDGTRYRAETMGPCQGLDFANRLAFVNRGGFQQIDRFSSVELGDGTRCSFMSFDKLKAPASSALDQYEKAGEAKPAEKPSGNDGEAKP